jgi:large subunit ribosomal protein L4
VSDAVFGAPVNKQLISQAVRVYLSNARQGTSKTKNRSEVNLTKKKVYKQKGTGGARHGAKSAPIFVGGGVTHGPRGNQNWSLSLPPVLKKLALISALSWQNQAIQVVDELETQAKTSQSAKILAAIAPEARSITVVLSTEKVEFRRSCRNIPNVTIIPAAQLTALDVIRANVIIMTSASVKLLEEKLAQLSKPAEKADAVAPTKKTAPTVKKKTTKSAKK